MEVAVVELTHPGSEGQEPEPALEDAVEGVRELVEMVRQSPVKRLRVDLGGLRVEIETTASPDPSPSPDHTAGQSTVELVADPPAVAASPAVDAAQVTAPLPGVFYGRPAPSEQPFVSVGDRVTVGQQVAIVEAMKLMNAVVADCAGTVAEIHVEDSAVVEFGQPIMTIERG
jgi:acetyl-CoA carboxylase biotin carboxyl carrier protein